MSIERENLKRSLKTLNLSYTLENIDKLLTLSINESLSYEKFLNKILNAEIENRENKKLEKRMKMASFPFIKTIDEFDKNEQHTLSEAQINQLKEVSWIEQGYNIILLGPSGVGKTHLGVGIGIEAIKNGYKAYFVTMSDLIHLLKTKEILRTSMYKIKHIYEADLLIIDDLMFMAVDKNEANLFFDVINKLYGQASIIITSNKGPEEWGELINDQVIITAILDRLLHKCEVINFSEEDSYRMKHHETIFGNV